MLGKAVKIDLAGNQVSDHESKMIITGTCNLILIPFIIKHHIICGVSLEKTRRKNTLFKDRGIETQKGVKSFF